MARTLRGERRILRAVLALYREGSMSVRMLGRLVAEPGENPEVVRRVLYRLLPDMQKSGLIEWRNRRVSLTPLAAESLSWLLDCLDVEACRTLMTIIVHLLERAGELPRSVYKDRDEGVRV